MGKFTYQTGPRVDIEDRALAHLQIVIANKLRRNESFVFTWRDPASIGDGRTSVWLSPSIPVWFTYYGSRTPALNRAWVEALAHTANASTGLYLVPEPAESTAAEEQEIVG